MTKAARNSKLQLFSILGNLIQEVDMSNKESLELQLGDFKAGLYIYKIISENGYQTGELIVK